MPFGQKRDERLGHVIDFDAIYRDGIKPALDHLPVDVIRADEERSGGVIHVAMFERLLLAEIAIVDVTIDNANVFYELGVRHTARGHSTIIVASKDRILPFDIAMVRSVPYTLDAGVLTLENAVAFAAQLEARVREMLAREDPDNDSPVFQMIPSYQGATLDFEPSSFRERSLRLNELRHELAAARHLDQKAAISAIGAIERQELAKISDANFELVLDVLLSYRDVKAFNELLLLVDRLPKTLYERSVRIHQLQAFALNKRNEGDDRVTAIGILQGIVNAKGDDSETCGLLGSIFKQRFDAAVAAKDPFKTKAALVESIKWYRRGFLADPRDYYPGINLCTLLALEGSGKSLTELKETIPAVRLAVRRSGGVDSNDYWVVATMLELAVLDNDWEGAQDAYGRIVVLAEGAPHEKPHAWMLESTGATLRRVADAEIASIEVEPLRSLIEANARTLQELQAAVEARV